MISSNKIKHINFAEENKLRFFGLKLNFISTVKKLDVNNFELSAQDKTRFLILNSKLRKGQFISARIALSSINEKLCEDIVYGGNRPELESMQGHISLSHSSNSAAAAWHPSLSVGIDIESNRPNLDFIKSKFLSSKEIEKIQLSKNPSFALRIAWGAKESIYKAANQKGLSFANDIHLDFTAESNNGKAIAHVCDGTKYSIGWCMVLNKNGSSEALVWAVQHPKTLRIVLTGPESTGKSTLSKSLGEHFDVPYLKECARDYLNEKNNGYGLKDLVKINDIQLKRQANVDSSKVFLDTDIITLIIWAKEKFNAPRSIFKSDIKNNSAHLYLLCRPDLPWVYDDQRENADDRDRIFNLFEKELEKSKIPFIYVQGKGRDRLKKAITSIQSQMF
ncbi:MAG: Uncharacterised protein [Owenweeksia sp. TMED14]|nr:MAG: Uncharacterised protein [Owenweeksia sp. TMED14]|tara:strand:+ start:1394 stop:2569 length:1176 start_codon:yes stop_codon:yes gene_type:complete